LNFVHVTTISSHVVFVSIAITIQYMKYTYQRRRLGNIHYKYLLADVNNVSSNK